MRRHTEIDEYLPIESLQDYSESESNCESLGTSLASIHSDQDQYKARLKCQSIITALGLSDPVSTSCWIGINSMDDNGATYKWVDGSAVNYGFYNNDGSNPSVGIFPWSIGEPNNSEQQCTQIWRFDDYKWDDDHCSVSKIPLCNKIPEPTMIPTQSPSINPSIAPTEPPSDHTESPSNIPSNIPSTSPTFLTRNPTQNPTEDPTQSPTDKPSTAPTIAATAHEILVKADVAFSAIHFLTNYTFSPPYNGKVVGIKMVYKSGGVTCDYHNFNHKTKWGCGNHIFAQMIVHKTNTNQVYYPTSATQGVDITKALTCINGNGCTVHYYTTNNYGPDSDFIELIDYSNPYNVSTSDVFSLQYSEGCCGESTDDNNGTTYADVYFFYQTYDPIKNPTISPTIAPTISYVITIVMLQ